MEIEKINYLEDSPKWLLRLKMIWSGLTSKNFFFVGLKKLDFSGKGKHQGIYSGSILPTNYKERKLILETIRSTIDGIIESYDELEKVEKEK